MNEINTQNTRMQRIQYYLETTKLHIAPYQTFKTLVIFMMTSIAVIGLIVTYAYLNHQNNLRHANEYLNTIMVLKTLGPQEAEKRLRLEFEKCNHPLYKILIGARLLGQIQQGNNPKEELEILKRMHNISRNKEVPQPIKNIITLRLNLFNLSTQKPIIDESRNKNDIFYLLEKEISIENQLNSNKEESFFRENKKFYKNPLLTDQMIKRIEYVMPTINKNYKAK